ncbi:FlgD immunoglobulin-like domain containing protein, partial [Candidatus Poribacteria bacterium]
QYQIGIGSGFDGRVDISLSDHAGNSATTNFNISYDNAGPRTPVDVKCDDGAEWNTTGEVTVTWSGEGDSGSGVANYFVEAENIAPQENPDNGSMSVTIPVDDGESIKFYVRGVDKVGNWGQTGSDTISVDTQAPSDVQEILHADSDANEGFDNDEELEFSWESASDNIEVDHYDVYLSVDGGAYELLESVGEEEFTAPGEDGKSHKLRVIAVDVAGNEGPATESEEIVCDISEPEFVVAMLPNPGFQNFIDIVVISLETLLEEPPALSVELQGERTVDLSEITENVWVGSYTIPGDVPEPTIATLVVSGTDLAGNEADDESNTFSVQTVLASAPARIQSTDGKLALNIPAGTLDRDTTVIMMAVPLDAELLQNLGTAQLAPGLNAETGKLDELEAVGQHYLISPSDAKFLKPANLTLQYGDAANVNEDHLGVYTWDSDASEWKYVDSVVDKKTGSIRALVDRFGTFGIYSDTKPPQVSHISPSDGTVLDTSLPEFTIGVADRGSGVDVSSLSLLIDDQPVSISRKYEEELAVLIPEHGLTAGDHTFSIVGEDMAGNDFASVRRNVHVPMWAVIPASSQLLQNYPNPFNPETWIPYRLSESADVRLSIYSLSGQLVRTLELGTMNPGTYTDRERAIYWDGRNKSGEIVSSGVYFYHLSAGEFTSTRKMVVAR